MNTVGYQGPKRGADRAVLLAHGAGADMHAAALTVTADALADAKIPSLRFARGFRSTASCWVDARWAVVSVPWSRPTKPIPFPRSDSRCSVIHSIRRASPRTCASSTSRG
jgi:hypothetical protein